MSYIGDNDSCIHDSEYQKALSYTLANGAIAGAFGLASVERALDGDIDTAKSSALIAGFSGTLTKGLYDQVNYLSGEDDSQR